MKKTYTIGIDYGTDSVRTLIADTSNGKEVAAAVHYYKRWKEGKYCDPASNRFRQHPMDYIEGLEKTVKEALSVAGPEVAAAVVGISVDTTGSTPVAVDRHGVPLSLKPGFEENPNAMFILWKDHTAVREAAEINDLAHSGKVEDVTRFVGGVYSSEWFWAKILHIMRTDAAVRKEAWSWVEHCDWIPALLTGNTDPLEMKRSRCAAGHKAMWHEKFAGLPGDDFLLKLDPLLKGIRNRLFTKTYTADVSAGFLSEEWAKRLGLSTNVAVGVGAFDAHLGAVGGQIRPYHLSKVMGTSTCDMLIAPLDEVGDKLVAGICGQVDGSIVPGMMGLEAGQSAFGDVYAWFSRFLMWPVENLVAGMDWLDIGSRNRIREECSSMMIAGLSKAAEQVPLAESSIVALDWLNGRRTPFANQELKAAITGLNLGTEAPAVFRALVEATAFGSKMINDRFKEEGVRIDGIIALGGVAKKSPFVMQIVCDVLNMPIRVAGSEQACALGSAMAASVVAGVWPDFATAQNAMGSGFDREYLPNPERAAIYEKLYRKYKVLGKFVESNQ